METAGSLAQVVMDAPLQGSVVTVTLLGLRYPCWRCGDISTPLVGMLEEGGDVFSAELVVCNDEIVLAFAWAHLPLEARVRWHVGEVKKRYSRASDAEYLSNGCAHCGALFGEFPLFHEALPEALATEGLATLMELAVIELSETAWVRIFESRWS